MSKLVIVESPTKADTIKKYLGKGYEVKASMGHVRDLYASKLSVDVAHDFAPKYVLSRERRNSSRSLQLLLKKVTRYFSQLTRTVKEKQFHGILQQFSVLTLIKQRE